MLFGWSSISIASLISRSMYRDWVDRILVTGPLCVPSSILGGKSS
jgi:hypothetical protein